MCQNNLVKSCLLIPAPGSVCFPLAKKHRKPHHLEQELVLLFNEIELNIGMTQKS